MPSRHRSGSGLRGSWFHLLWYLARSGWGTNGSYDSYELWRFLFVHKGRIWRILNTWALQSMILARWILLRLRSLLWSPCIPDSFASFAGHSAYGTSQTNRQAAARATPQQDTLAGALRRPYRALGWKERYFDGGSGVPRSKEKGCLSKMKEMCRFNSSC